MPRRKPKPPKRVLFFDANGKFVSPVDRYKKAVKVMRYVRGKYREVTEGEKVITPRRLVDLLTQDEFEHLPATFGSPRDVKPTARKYIAWDLSQKAVKVRGLRGKAVRVTMTIKDGKATRIVSFIHQFRHKGARPYGLFKHMNEAIGNIGGFLYNRIRSKLLSDRKGRQMRLQGIRLEPEM